MEKGILLELDGRNAVVLTPRGEFKRIPAPQGTCEIGDEVSFAEPRAAAFWTRMVMPAVAAAVFFAAGWVGWDQYTLLQPVSLVTIDINPSVQLTLNKKDQVLEAAALNDDGKLVLTGVEWKRHPADEVIAAVTAKAVEVGKLNPSDTGSAVLVSVSPAKGATLPAQHADELAAKTKVAVSETVQQKARDKKVEAKTSVAAVEATARERDEAEAQGLTPGKFLLFQVLKEQRPEVKSEEMKVEGPGKLLKSLGINPGDLFGKAEESHGRSKDKKEESDQEKAGQEKSEQGRSWGPARWVTGQPDSKDSDGEKASREKASREKAEKDKAERDKAEKDKAERDKAERDKAERDKAERDKAERAKSEREKSERAKSEREKAEQEKAARDRDKAEREKRDRERADREKADKQTKESDRETKESDKDRSWDRREDDGDSDRKGATPNSPSGQVELRLSAEPRATAPGVEASLSDRQSVRQGNDVKGESERNGKSSGEKEKKSDRDQGKGRRDSENGREHR